MPRRYIRTSEIAKATGVHPNTVRLYEEWGFIAPVPRSPAGYRLFTEAHLDQMRLARTALQFPYPGGKSLVIELVHCAIQGDFENALERAHIYQQRVRAERAHAEAAADYLEHWVQGMVTNVSIKPMQIGEVAVLLDVSRDVLRDWERNGLITVSRHPQNRYRLYWTKEVGRLRVIRTLRQARYSVMAILRMLLAFDSGQKQGLRQLLDTPNPEEDICYITDRWISTLSAQEQRTYQIISQLEEMKIKQNTKRA